MPAGGGRTAGAGGKADSNLQQANLGAGKGLSRPVGPEDEQEASAGKGAGRHGRLC